MCSPSFFDDGLLFRKLICRERYSVVCDTWIFSGKMTRFSISAYHFIHSGVGEIEEADIFEIWFRRAPSLRVASSSFVTSLVKTRQDVDFDPEVVRAHFHSKSLDRGPSHHKPSFWPSLLKSRPTPLRGSLQFISHAAKHRLGVWLNPSRPNVSSWVCRWACFVSHFFVSNVADIRQLHQQSTCKSNNNVMSLSSHDGVLVSSYPSRGCVGDETAMIPPMAPSAFCAEEFQGVPRGVPDGVDLVCFCN